MSEINELAEKLKSEGEKILAIFEALTDSQWQTEVYTEGEMWTIRSVLAHLVTAERSLVKLFERIRATGEGSAEDFSIDRYNEAQQRKTRELSRGELLEQYKEVRAASAAWVLGLKSEELDIRGRHPFLGMTTVRDMIKLLYIHNLDHYRDMKKVLN